MASTTGLFGSNVGGGRKRPMIVPHTPPPGKALKVPVASVHAAPSIHVASKSVPASLLTPPKAPTSSSSGSQAVPKAMSFAVGGQGTGGGGSASDLFGGVEGFIGHLGSDIVHTALGMPAGFTYLFEHPIAGIEGAAKMTWNDWSPLFHGDYRTWLHNTYQHPLAPILDVMSVVTGGAAIAGRAATVAGRVGEVAAGADAAEMSAATSTVVRKAGVGVEETAKRVAASGFKTSSTMEKFLRFGNPAKYSAEVYGKIADNLGYTAHTPEALAERTKFISTAMNNDPIARRVLYSKAGIMHSARDVNKNPLIRGRQRYLAKAGNAAAARSDTLGKVVGDEAIFKRFIHMDIGSRRAAMVRLVQHQLATAHRMGQTTSSMTHTEIAQTMEKAMYEGITAHAHVVERKGAAGSAEEAAQLKQLSDEGGQLLRDQEHALPDLEAAWKHIEKHGAKGYSDFFEELWSKARTTDNPAEAHLSPEGHWMVVSRPDKVSKEAFFSEKVVRNLYVNPTKVWKYLLLGASPRYFVNNFVGNTLMLLAATDPVSTAKAFYSHMRLVFGARKADRMAEEDIRAMASVRAKRAATRYPHTAAHSRAAQARLADRTIEARRLYRSTQGGHVLEKWYGAEYGFGNSNRLDENGLPALGKIDKVTRFNLHGVTHKYADMPQRYMAMIYSLKRIPEFQSAYASLRAAGKDHWAAEEGAIDAASANPAVRQMVRGQVNHMLGQYHTFTSVEHAVRNVIPFYAWDRAITKHMAHLVTQSPYKVAMGAAIGTLGNQKIEQIMGQVPDFLQSAIPAKLLSGPLSPLRGLIGSSPDGRMGILNAYSLSPYGSVSDLTTMALAATGQGKFRVGDSLGGQLNPLIQQTASELSGVDLQTGAPTGNPTGGPIAGLYLGAFQGVPQVNLLKAAIGWDNANTTKAGNPTLYQHDLQAATSSFLGLAIRQVNLDAAHAVARLQSGKKHLKDKKYNPFPGL